MTHPFFEGLAPIKYEGADAQNPMAFRHYNPDEMVIGKRLEDHRRGLLAQFCLGRWGPFWRTNL